METMTCPRCGTQMEERNAGRGQVLRCPDGHGVFLDRASLGDLIDAEVAWHQHADARHTAPLPRITADMTAPPAYPVAAPAWVASLFD
ncbi:TFIIB-type zinc ribbon-containing protein [Nocardioides alcanivorans]|uniref:TFIIB-type zinc ribbon-containing protein n=1 Tax=Nocardioides alcanivorans TaxID=2897352 RepID=UPI001F2B80FE|nr:zf-TFIIB domain-containing protein [Nocardioides alcanivorans]